ncbi:MAG: hypothetical protein QM747_03210 [Nocardioides sp.]
MAEPEQFTRSYRLVAAGGEVIDERELPTDGEALAWAEDLRRHREPRVWIRRVERRDGETWVLVPASGESPADQ